MGRVQGAALAHLGLTCVHYPPEASLAHKLIALASVWPIVAISYSLAKVRHAPTPRHLLSFLGLIVAEIVARSLKHLVKQSRPQHDAALLLGLGGSSHGWPSSHAAAASAFASLETLAWARQPPPRRALPQALRALEIATFWALALLCATSRVVLHYHTAAQVAAGLAVGAATAGGWWALTVEQP
jgi:membrane-associated phospholipid phosphatase